MSPEGCKIKASDGFLYPVGGFSIWEGESMAEERVKRKLTAILSADVKGYSRLMGEDEISTMQTLKKYRELMVSLVREYEGRVIDSPGDNILADFGSVVDAVECAVKIQRELKEGNAKLSEDRRMEFRIGVNLGDVIDDDGRIYGDGVNVASRVEGLAEGGGICISGTAFDQIGKKLPLGYEYLGEQEVKNIEKPVRVYKVLTEPEDVGKLIGEEKPKPKGQRWAVLAAAVVILVVGGAFAVWTFYLRPDVEPASVEKMAFPLPDKPSIAVLPFTNMTGDPKQEYFSDGLTENIITGLSKIRDLFVIARHSTFSYKGKAIKVQQVSEDLGVRYVLEGGVMKSGDRLRITVQLIDAIKGHHIWSELYDRELKDIFVLQDEITMKIIKAMEIHLTRGESIQFHTKRTNNLQAYLKYLEAVGYLRQFSREDNILAKQKAEDVISLDPNYADGYHILGWTHVLDIWLGLSTSPKHSLKKATELAKKGIEMDQSNADTHRLLAVAYAMMRLYEAAIAEGKKALELDPNSAGAHFHLGQVLHWAGRHQEAIPLLEKAVRLNPYPPSYYLHTLAPAYRFSGRLEEAIKCSQKAVKRSPNDPNAWLGLAANYSQAGQLEEARAAAKEVLRIQPDFSLERFAKILPWKNRADVDLAISLLRKAGLSDEPPLPLPDKPSIAVLPFVNMSGDPEQEYLSDGISEEIITALSKSSQLFVIARTSSFKYKGKEVDVRTVGRELGVKYVLEGSVRKAGDKVRVTAQLIDAQTNNHIWAERYDRDLKDIFAIQDDITKNIITSIHVKLTLGEEGTLSAEGTRNLDAYLYYLQARDHMWRFNKEDNMKARQLAEKSIALDPEYDKGYSVLASVEIANVWLGASKSPEEAFMRCIELAKKSIAIRDSPIPHRVLAMIYLLLSQHSAALEEARKAIEMAPNYADAYMTLGLVYNHSDMEEKAVPVLQKAIRLNPYPPSAYYEILAWSYYFLGKYDEAIAKGKGAISVNPKDFHAHLVLICAYFSMGREEEARAHAAEVLRIDPNFSVDKAERTTPLTNKGKLKRIMQQYRMAGLPD